MLINYNVLGIDFVLFMKDIVKTSSFELISHLTNLG